MGSMYVNDFTYLNKSYRVYAQADKDFRTSPEILGQFYVRNYEGDMVPLSNFITYSTIHSADTIYHYNLRRSTEITGSAAQGTSMGQAVKEMEKLAEKVLPQNFSYEWSGIVLEQQESGSLAGLIFALQDFSGLMHTICQECLTGAVQFCNSAEDLPSQYFRAVD